MESNNLHVRVVAPVGVPGRDGATASRRVVDAGGFLESYGAVVPAGRLGGGRGGAALGLAAALGRHVVARSSLQSRRSGIEPGELRGARRGRRRGCGVAVPPHAVRDGDAAAVVHGRSSMHQLVISHADLYMHAVSWWIERSEKGVVCACWVGKDEGERDR